MSPRDVQRQMARRVVRASNRGTGLKLSPDQVYELWRSFMNHWGGMAADDLPDTISESEFATLGVREV